MATKAMKAMKTMSATALKATRSTSTMKAMKAMKAITHVKVPAFLGAGRLKKLKPKADLIFSSATDVSNCEFQKRNTSSALQVHKFLLNTNPNLLL